MKKKLFRFDASTGLSLTFLVFLLAGVAQAQTDCALQSDIQESECEALLALYNSAGGPGWTSNEGWNVTDTPCLWFGVVCFSDNVGSLNLVSNNLIGTIPSALENLISLSTLNLALNQLTGPIPPELGNLAGLQSLNLSGNLLNGSIPPDLGDLFFLNGLDLHTNQLTGSIPPAFANLANLQDLDLSDNSLTGTIPPGLGTLNGLQNLKLSDNPIMGEIPPELGDLNELMSLEISGTQVTGSIPPELGNPSSLHTLVLSDNQLTGTVPPALGNPTLTELLLQGNQLSGDLPLTVAMQTYGPGSCNLTMNALTFCVPDTVAYQPFADVSNRICGVTLGTPCGTNLSLSKLESVDPVIAGSDLTYTLTVNNNGPYQALDVVVTDLLPAGVALVSTTGCAEDPSGVANCSLGTIPAAASAEYTVTVGVNPAATGVLTNSASVSSSTIETDPSDNSAEQTTTVMAITDLEIVLEAPASVFVGEDLTAEARVRNLGLSPAELVRIQARPLSGVELVSADVAGIPCVGTSFTTCHLGTVAPGALRVARFVLRRNTPGQLLMNVGVVSQTADPQPDNNQATLRVGVEAAADLVLTKSAPSPILPAGSEFAYTLTIENRGPSAATEVMLAETLPAGLEVLGLTTQPEAACELGTGVQGEASSPLAILCQPLAVSQTVTIELQVRLDPLATADLVNQAGVTAAEQDPDESNNQAVTITPTCGAPDGTACPPGPPTDLEVVKTVEGGLRRSVSVGDTLVYRLNVTNNGPEDANGVVLRDSVPDHLEILEAPGCEVEGQEVTCDIGSLADGASRDFLITTQVAPGAPGPLTNTATVSGNLEEDPVQSNNSSSVSLEIALVGDLNLDGTVDARDVYLVLQELNGGGGDPAFDINRDGGIDQADLIALAEIALDKLPSETQERFLLGSAAATSVLNFPRLTFSEGELTGVAIANPGSTDAEVLLTAYDHEGQILAQSNQTIPAGQQFAQLTSELFGELPGDTVGWFQATSSAPDLTGFFLDLDGALTGLDGADIPLAALRIVFNKVRVDEGFQTELNIVNTGNKETEVELTLVGGPVPIPRRVAVAARGVLRLDVEEFFLSDAPAGDSELPAQAYVTASAGKELVGFETLRSSSGDFESLNAQSALSFLNAIYIPQIAIGFPFESVVGLVNYSQQPALVTVTAHQANGDLFIEGAGENPVTRLLQPGESLVEDVVEMFQFEESFSGEGWLEITSTSQVINGYFSYRLPTLGAAATVAAVSQPSQTAVFSHLATVSPAPGFPGFFTGIAALNPTSLPANIRILAVSAEGILLGNFTGVLNVGDRFSKLITELIPASADQNGGLIFVRSNVPIFMTALFGTNDLRVLANVPPQAVPGAFRPDASVPQVRVNPPLSVLQPGAKAQFQVTGAVGTSYNWSVNGVAGGDTEGGTIDAQGAYTAPATQPLRLPVTVIAAGMGAAASASVDVIEAQTLLGNLGVVQSLSFLDSLQRFYTAEFSVSGGSSSTIVPSGQPYSEIFGISPEDRSSVARFDGDEIRKIVPFTARDGHQYLLASGGLSGQIYRIDPRDGTHRIVASELPSPGTMVVDPLTGDLFVAVTGRLVTVPRKNLEEDLALRPSALEEEDGPRQGVTVDLDGITGIGVDACTGNLLIAQAALGRILSLSRSSGQASELFSGLTAPGNLLVLYRSGVGCPEATQVLIIEEGASRLSLGIPSAPLLISPWVPTPASTDLTFVPPASVFGEPASILVVTAAGGGVSTVATIAVPDLYTQVPVNPPLYLPGAASTSPPGADLAVSIGNSPPGASSVLDLFFRPGPDDGEAGGGSDEAGLLLLTIDYDEFKLALDGGTLAAALEASLPAGISVLGFHDPADTEGEIGLLILDLEAPFETFQDGNLLKLSFQVDPAAQGTADVRITGPGPQLLDLLGQLLTLNEVVNGGVRVKP